MRTASDKWRIQHRFNFVTGASEWEISPPRWIYRPHAVGKRSFPTYDQALAHVHTAKERRPIVFESKTHIGEWFWLNPNGQSGWEKDRAEAHLKAGASAIETAGV